MEEAKSGSWRTDQEAIAIIQVREREWVGPGVRGRVVRVVRFWKYFESDINAVSENLNVRYEKEEGPGWLQGFWPDLDRWFPLTDMGELWVRHAPFCVQRSSVWTYWCVMSTGHPCEYE